MPSGQQPLLVGMSWAQFGGCEAKPGALSPVGRKKEVLRICPLHRIQGRQKEGKRPRDQTRLSGPGDGAESYLAKSRQPALRPARVTQSKATMLFVGSRGILDQKTEFFTAVIPAFWESKAGRPQF